MSDFSVMHPKTSKGKSLHCSETDQMVADAWAKRSKQPKHCFVCGKLAWYLSASGQKAACRDHKKELMQ